MNFSFTSSRTSNSASIKFNVITELITSFTNFHRFRSNSVLKNFVEEIRDAIAISAQRRIFKNKKKKKTNRLNFKKTYELKLIRMKNDIIR